MSFHLRETAEFDIGEERYRIFIAKLRYRKPSSAFPYKLKWSYVLEKRTPTGKWETVIEDMTVKPYKDGRSSLWWVYFRAKWTIRPKIKKFLTDLKKLLHLE